MHIEKEHAAVDQAKVTSEKEYIEQIVNENSKLKNELRSVKDDFERLSEIYRKEQQDFKDLKLNIDIDLSKTREEYRRMKVENEKLIARNDTLYKLGNIALNQKEKKTEKESENRNDEDNIEIIEEEVIDIESIVKDKLRGFRRTNPTSTPQAENNTGVSNARLYSQAASSPPTDKHASQEGQHHNQGQRQQ